MNSSPKVELKLDWATHEAAKYACENWHYSGCLPAGKITKIGVWENSKFVGVVLYSRGASPDLLTRYGLQQTEGCELTRIALTKHSSSVSKIMAISFKLLRKISPGLKLIVSFADPGQGHHGGVYQASNWVYAGISSQGGAREYLIDGKWIHQRSMGAKFGKAGKEFADSKGIKHRKPTRKHVYLMPLDKGLKEKIIKLSMPYPKRAGSKETVAVSDQDTEGGENPTSALQNS